MNYIDMFILVLLIYAIFRGFTKGFIMQLTLLIALAIGIFAALKLSGFTSEKLESRINVNPESLYLISLALTFILVFIGINLLGRIVEKMAENAELSMLNRVLGVIFGLAKTVFIVGILLTFLDRADRKVHILPKYSREHSVFYKPFTVIVTTIFPSLKPPDSDSGYKEFVWNNTRTN
jgi:membrane protein required for colicin V production